MMKNKLTIISSGYQNLNTQIIQINPGPALVIKQKGNKMRKMIASVLLAVVLSTSIVSTSQAYWEEKYGRYYWCNSLGQCR